jgi:hypothetical protein
MGKSIPKLAAALLMALGIAVIGGSVVGGIALAVDRGSPTGSVVDDSPSLTGVDTDDPAAGTSDDSGVGGSAGSPAAAEDADEVADDADDRADVRPRPTASDDRGDQHAEDDDLHESDD